MAGGTIAKLSASLAWDLEDFQRGTSVVEGAFKGIIGLAGKVGDAVTNAGKRMTVGMTLPLTGLGVLFTKAAADASELQSAFDYTFGNMAGRMNRWAEQTGDAMGRATGEMQEGALAFGQLFKAAAPTEAAAARLSQRFTVLAQDAASFYNTDFDTAMGKIRSGLTGESEPLRDFGVFLTEAAVAAKAVELGLVDAGQEVNEYGKIMARSALIAEGLSDAQGDVERTSTSLSNQVRKIKGDLRELAEEIGGYLEPYAQKLASVVEGVVERFKNLPDGVKRAAVGFGVFLAALGPLSIALSALAVAILPLVLVKMGPLFAIISAIVNPIGTLVVVAGKMVAKFGGIGAVLGRIAPLFLRFLGPVGLVITALQLFGGPILRGLQAFGRFVSEAVGDGIRELFASLSDTIDRVSEALDAFMQSPVGEFLQEVVGFVGMLLEALLTLAGYLTGQLIGAFFEVFTAIADLVGGVIETAVKLLTGDWAGAWDAAVQTVGRAIIRIGEWISQIWPWLGGMIQMLGELTGAKLSTPNVGQSLSGDPFHNKNPLGGGGKPGGSDFEGGNFAVPAKVKPSKKARTPRTPKGRTGPTAEELAERREEIKLEQQLNLAREKGDQDAIRALERQRDLKRLIERYDNAGLSKADARVAAEKDLAEIDAARAEVREKLLTDYRIETEYQVALLNNDYEHLRYLDEEKELKDRIAELNREGYDLATAERIARASMLNIEKARADAQERRLRDQQDQHELELARLRGDDPALIRRREDAVRTRDRTEDLIRDGMGRREAEAQAQREASDLAKAHMQGNFRDAFRAALDGDLKGFFQRWMQDSSFNALSKVLDRLADRFADLIAGGGQGGGGGLLGSLFSIISGKPTSAAPAAGGGEGAWTPIASGRATALPGFARGGGGIIKGYPGIDKNLLSLNGNPIARVGHGELLNVRPANEAGYGATRVEIVPTPYFDAHVDGRAATVAAPMAMQAAGAGSAGAQMSLARSRKRSMA